MNKEETTMKKIVILMNHFKIDRPVAEFIQMNLYEVILPEEAQITTLYLDQFESESLDDTDLILLSSPKMLHELGFYLKDRLDKVLFMTRTLSRESLRRIREIPAQTEVLVHNASQETTNDLIQLFYQLGIMHLKFIPYIEKSQLNSYEYLVSAVDSFPKEKESFQGKLISIGYRKLDTQTFLNIFSYLKIDTENLATRLFQYIESMPRKDIAAEERYLSAYILKKAFLTVIDEIDVGILIMDHAHKVIYNNAKASRFLGGSLKKGESLEAQLSPDIIEELLGTEGLLRSQDEYVVIKRTTLYDGEKILGYFFDLKASTNIDEWRIELNKKLRGLGLYAKYRFQDIKHRSWQMQEQIDFAKAVAETEHAVLLEGETGTGKELFAQAIHNYSKRKLGPFVAVNCAALPESLLESELFGYEAGSFTGSQKNGKIGLFELANHGTIFLDEIAEVPRTLQAKLLRVLQEKQVMRIGSNSLTDIDIRVITATNCHLLEEIREKNFRDDLYYRLSTFIVKVPALRERKEDIIPLFLEHCGAGCSLNEFQKQTLIEYPWPGNVRELMNVAKYYDLTGKLDCLPKEDLTSGLRELDDYIPEILKILLLNEEQGIGRGRLQETLKKNGIELSENRLEKILAKMKEQKYLLRSKGRGGMKITTQGKEIL